MNLTNTLSDPNLEKYYDEIDPAKRYAHLTAFLNEAVPTAADAYRIDLFNLRYGSSVKKGLGSIFGGTKKARGSSAPDSVQVPVPPGEGDLYLRHILNLLSMRKNSGLFPKRLRKDALAVLAELRLDDRPLRDQACGEVFYLEFRNAVRRYFATCHDSSYGRKLFGLSSSSDSEKEVLRCRDTWDFSFGIAHMLDLTDEMEILCRAANDEYCDSAPGAESLEAAYQSFGGDRKR